MNYEVLLFDADDTLFDFRKAERYAFLQALDYYNIKKDKEECIEIYSDINTRIWKEFERGEITADKLRVERFERFFNVIDLNLNAYDFSRTYAKLLGEGAFIFEDSEEVIKYLSGKYKLILVTNGLEDVQKSRLAKSPLKNYFDGLVISDEIKIAKPDPRIFDYALELIKHNNKKTVLIIGDSLTSDMQGGVNAGIDTCWYNPIKKINNSNLTLTYEINDLKDLKKIL